MDLMNIMFVLGIGKLVICIMLFAARKLSLRELTHN